MRRPILVAVLISAAICKASWIAAAEDHSQHTQQHGSREPREPDAAAVDPHAGHESHDPLSSPASNTEPAQHDTHAGHQSESPTQSEREHVPPEAPSHPFGNLSEERMIELMQMEDNAAYSMIQLDELEWRRVDDHDALAWDLQAWYGTDYDKVWVESEGERSEGASASRAEVMWDRIVSPWWSVQAGVRHDFSAGPSRTWAAVGLQGLAPYFFEVDATLYLGEHGRTAARFSGEYEMRITQQWILQPEVEMNLYGKRDVEQGIGSGLSSLEAGLRLRYEIRRELAPYLGVHWERSLGSTADLVRQRGDEVSDVVAVAGIRMWF